MKIELCEDDGFLNDGKPSLVVLLVTNDDGKQVRIPYQAEKTIQELYVDVAKINDDKAWHKPAVFHQPDPIFITNHVDPVQKMIRSNEIEKEDIVRCIKKLPREEGADDDLTVGDEYRVIFVKKEKGHILYYDVLDDKADNRYRITVAPEEIELVRKRKPKTNPVKKDYKQEIVKCPKCKEDNAIDLVPTEDHYAGKCENCHTPLRMERPVVKSDK